MEKFSKLLALFIILSFSFIFISCDNADDDYEDQYPAEIQAEANEFCDYWAFCGTEFYGNKGDAWDDTINGCKSFFYQNYDLRLDPADINDDCYDCLMEEHARYLSNFTDSVSPTIDQCHYPSNCYMSSGDCQIPLEE